MISQCLAVEHFEFSGLETILKLPCQTGAWFGAVALAAKSGLTRRALALGGDQGSTFR